MNILITLCARGGSKGLPGKNIRSLNGIPLIGYSIKIAQEFQKRFPNVDIELSTDSTEIKKVCESFDLYSNYTRPEHLATDSAGKIDAIKDVLFYREKSTGVRYDFLLDLDVTSPLRSMSDLEDSFSIIKENDEALNLFSVNPAHRNPYFNMVEIKDNNFYGLVKPLEVLTRQSAPKVYDMNASFYFYKKAFFTENHATPITSFSLIYEMKHICFDVDNAIDFEFMSFLIKNNKLDFELI